MSIVAQHLALDFVPLRQHLKMLPDPARKRAEFASSYRFRDQRGFRNIRQLASELGSEHRKVFAVLGVIPHSRTSKLHLGLLELLVSIPCVLIEP